jgi:5-methylcytosine-specific restriction enzyme subunit McrC
MPLLFQNFVFNFLRREQSRFSVRGERIRWAKAAGSESALAFLPTMQTDGVLSGLGQKIVVDTKFYPEALARFHKKEMIRSEHLYQIYAYVKNLAAAETTDIDVRGVLLYPSVGRSIELDYTLDGHDFSVRSIDLDQPWTGVRRSLLALFNC